MSHPNCSVEHCERPAGRRSGWCPLHYQRWYRTGDPLKVRPRGGGTRRKYFICIVEGCPNLPASRQMCDKHYTRWMRHGDPNKTLRAWRSDNPERADRRGHWQANRLLNPEHCELEPHGYCSPSVIVHHVNEDPTDNRPENLRVLCTRHHILHHRGDFDLDNPDHSRYYVTAKGTLRRRAA